MPEEVTFTPKELNAIYMGLDTLVENAEDHLGHPSFNRLYMDIYFRRKGRSSKQY